jgi:hypothetical protein
MACTRCATLACGTPQSTKRQLRPGFCCCFTRKARARRHSHPRPPALAQPVRQTPARHACVLAPAAVKAASSMSAASIPSSRRAHDRPPSETRPLLFAHVLGPRDRRGLPAASAYAASEARTSRVTAQTQLRRHRDPVLRAAAAGSSRRSSCNAALLPCTRQLKIP